MSSFDEKQKREMIAKLSLYIAKKYRIKKDAKMTDNQVARELLLVENTVKELVAENKIIPTPIGVATRIANLSRSVL